MPKGCRCFVINAILKKKTAFFFGFVHIARSRRNIIWRVNVHNFIYRGASKINSSHYTLWNGGRCLLQKIVENAFSIYLILCRDLQTTNRFLKSMIFNCLTIIYGQSNDDKSLKMNSKHSNDIIKKKTNNKEDKTSTHWKQKFYRFFCAPFYLSLKKKII